MPDPEARHLTKKSKYIYLPERKQMQELLSLQKPGQHRNTRSVDLPLFYFISLHFISFYFIHFILFYFGGRGW